MSYNSGYDLCSGLLGTYLNVYICCRELWVLSGITIPICLVEFGLFLYEG